MPDTGAVVGLGKVTLDIGDGRAGMTGESVPSPSVSVVVPVRGRVAATERMLAGVRAAARCPEPVEVLLVDDSGPEDAARHREQCERHGARYLRGPRHAGRKRNLGAAHASHDLLLFLGSDCRASPGLLRRYVKTIRMATGSESVRSVWRRLYRYGGAQQWLAVVHPDRRVPRCNPVVAVGAAVAAVQLRRPGLLFTGFRRPR